MQGNMETRSDGNTGIRSRPVKFGVAWRALRQLVADPERTDLVFVIIRALSGNSLERSFQRVMADPEGVKTLDEGRSLLDTLSDLETLRALPEGTLGRTYAAFMDEQGLTARGLVEASELPEDDDVVYLDPRAQRLGERMRDMHDLWHVVTGYNRDLLGEDALLAFTYAQTRNRGIGFIALMGMFELWRHGMSKSIRIVRDGYRRGRSAAFLPAADWEALLARPLVEVRKELSLADPPGYTPLWQNGGTPSAAAAS